MDFWESALVSNQPPVSKSSSLNMHVPLSADAIPTSGDQIVVKVPTHSRGSPDDVQFGRQKWDNPGTSRTSRHSFADDEKPTRKKQRRRGAMERSGMAMARSRLTDHEQSEHHVTSASGHRGPTHVVGTLNSLSGGHTCFYPTCAARDTCSAAPILVPEVASTWTDGAVVLKCVCSLPYSVDG